MLKITQKVFRLLLPVCLLSVLFFVSTGIPQAWADSAVANQNSVLIALTDSGEGIGQQVKGKADETLGKAQRNFSDDLDDQTEGGLKELQGKTEQAAGRAKVSLDRAGDKAENALDKAGNRTQEASEGFIERVKDIFD